MLSFHTTCMYVWALLHTACGPSVQSNHIHVMMCKISFFIVSLMFNIEVHPLNQYPRNKDSSIYCARFQLQTYWRVWYWLAIHSYHIAQSVLKNRVLSKLLVAMERSCKQGASEIIHLTTNHYTTALVLSELKPLVVVCYCGCLTSHTALVL